ncbi:predicted protein [Naegleria gruberi]|uniref:Predicted protein n=1 Tax=Naegleria gruberi TaxID=5762 RepID=D2UZT9_NAEGR|nr:uncharacterized protein NAEGRDRAFT_62059 [Naegleria gruberi]EFC50220.1 predicted protein [Naegleria gruberi]|eukprot:XP_002682964.1 predicted protein [Naegleria gruberi strain NEG-M]
MQSHELHPQQPHSNSGPLINVSSSNITIPFLQGNQSHVGSGGGGLSYYTQSVVDGGSTANSETSATSHTHSSFLHVFNEKLINFYISVKSSEVSVKKYEKILIYLAYAYLYWVNVIFPTISSDTRYDLKETEHVIGPYGVYSGWVFKVLNYPITFSLDDIDYTSTIILTCILLSLYCLFFLVLFIEYKTLKGKAHTRLRNLRQRAGAVCAILSPLTMFLMSYFIQCNTTVQVYAEKENVYLYMLTRNSTVACHGDPNLILFIVMCCMAPVIIFATSCSILLMPNHGHSSLPFTSNDNFPIMSTVASIGLEIFVIFLIPQHLIFIRGIIHILSSILQIFLLLKLVPLLKRNFNSVYSSAVFGRFGASIGVFINQLVFVFDPTYNKEKSLGLMGLTLSLIVVGGILGGIAMEIYTRVVCYKVRKVLRKGIIHATSLDENRKSTSVMEKEAVAIYMEQESLRNLNLFLRFSGENSDDSAMALTFIKLVIANKCVQSPEILLTSALIIAYQWVDENRTSFSSFILKKALRFVENSWTRTLIHERMKEIEIDNSTKSNGINQVEVKAMLNDIERKEDELWAVHRMFWKEVLSDLPNEKKISQLNSKATSLTVYCDKLFNHLMTNFKHDKTVLRFYASYLENFKFDKETSSILFEQAFQMEEEESKTRTVSLFSRGKSEKRFKNKITPYFNSTPNSPVNVFDIRKNSFTLVDNPMEDHEKEDHFDGIENAEETIDKKQVFFRNSLNTPYQSKFRNVFLIGLSILSVLMLVVAFALCMIFGSLVTEIPLTLQSCLPGTSPSALIREVRMGQIYKELYGNQNWAIPNENSTDGKVLNYFTTNHKMRFERHLLYLQQLADNSMTSKYTEQMFNDYTSPENPIVVPIASVEKSTISYLTSYKKNVSMSELTQEFMTLTKSFIDWTPKDYNETITSYLFMYLYLNRRTAADANALFCSKFQESKRVQNADIDLILRYYLFISTGVLIIIYSMFLVISRIEMRKSTNIITLFKRLPKDIIGNIYQDLQRKTNQEAKHLGEFMNPKWISIAVGFLALLCFSLYVSLMYMENYLNVQTASETMVNIDTATAVMRAAIRLTVRLSELYAFLGVKPGRNVNNVAIGSASQLATYRTDNRDYISEVQTRFTELLFGSEVTAPIIGKYSRVDEIITSPLTCSFNGTCYKLQELVAIVTHACSKFNEDIWNPFFAIRQDTFISYLDIFNLTDEMINRLTELLNSLSTNTSNSSKAISIVFFIVGIITLPLFNYIIFLNYQMSDNEITMLRSFLNYIPVDYFDSNDTLKNFALYNTMTKHSTKRKKIDTDDSIRNLLNSMVEGAVLCNEKGEITLFNVAAQKMFGKSATDVIGLPCIILFDEISHELIKNLTHHLIHSTDNSDELSVGEVIEIECIRKNQTKFPAQISIFGTEVNNGSIIISLVIKDITTEKKQNALLAEEKKNSENLLRNILPDAVATKLKNGETFIAEKFADITCFFSDMVGFTKLSSNMNPSELVLMLNSIVNGFDDLTDKYSLEKIKTIGDAYFCVGGLHNNPQSDHPERCIKFSIETLTVIRTYNAENPSSQVNIRIGLNTGSVVAGVIGRKKFAYDLWGDTINLSSRMESTGIPGRIHISRSTYERIYDLYEFEERSIEVKGKGMCQTYLLKEKHHVNPIFSKTPPTLQHQVSSSCINLEENDIEVVETKPSLHSHHDQEEVVY